MKRISLITLIVILMFILGGCSTSLPQIGVLDMEKVLDESQRARELREELSKIGTELEEEYAEQENIQQEEDNEEDLDNLYRQFLENKQRIESELNQEINEIVAEIFDEEKFDIVLNQQDVQYGGKDITEQVISRLDEKYRQGGVSGEEEEGNK